MKLAITILAIVALLLASTIPGHAMAWKRYTMLQAGIALWVWDDINSGRLTTDGGVFITLR